MSFTPKSDQTISEENFKFKSSQKLCLKRQSNKREIVKKLHPAASKTKDVIT